MQVNTSGTYIVFKQTKNNNLQVKSNKSRKCMNAEVIQLFKVTFT